LRSDLVATEAVEPVPARSSWACPSKVNWYCHLGFSF